MIKARNFSSYRADISVRQKNYVGRSIRAANGCSGKAVSLITSMAMLSVLPHAVSNANAAGTVAAIAQPLSGRVLSPHLHRVQARTNAIRVGNVAGPADASLPLDISLVDGGIAKEGELFIFSGIPEGVTLQPGGNLGHFWAVNSKVFPELTLKAERGLHGSFVVTIRRAGVAADDNERVSSFTVTIAPVSDSGNTETVAAITRNIAPSEDPIQQQTRPAYIPSLQDNALMERATELFSNGDVSAARAVFQVLTARGNPEAAIALGGTYDPIVLSQLFIKGLDPDPEQALKWYETAEQLGSPSAKNRLEALLER